MQQAWRLIQRHPLAFVLAVALAVRLVAVIYSRGFIHSDDHFDTIEVAYDWLRNGLWGSDGLLRWKDQSGVTVGRFPLYTLFLYAIMKAYHVMGISSLNTMMYGIRLIHALISLLPVWAIFRVTQRVTGQNDWAIIGGLAAGLHFAMPFLGVRNLIEMVGGNIWIVTLYFLYRFRDDKHAGWLYAAGLIAGLAWMIRFQIAFAILPIPLLLWGQSRSLRPALQFTIAVGSMLVLSGIVDALLVGKFAATTINNLAINTRLGPRYGTVPLLSPLVILLAFIPPFSLLLVYLAAASSFWKNHRLLVISTLFFIVIHMLHANQQERFMVPIFPALILIAVLAVWSQFRRRGYVVYNQTIWRYLSWWTLAVNLVLLAFFTGAYGHKGMIEPLVWISRMNPRPRVMVVQPDLKRWMPIDYAGLEPLKRKYVRSWDDLSRVRPEERGPGAFDLFLLYPQNAGDLQAYLDSVQNHYGPVREVGKFPSSWYDRVMHTFNPGHYGRMEAAVYGPSGL